MGAFQSKSSYNVALEHSQIRDAPRSFTPNRVGVPQVVLPFPIQKNDREGNDELENRSEHEESSAEVSTPKERSNHVSRAEEKKPETVTSDEVDRSVNQVASQAIEEETTQGVTVEANQTVKEEAKQRVIEEATQTVMDDANFHKQDEAIQTVAERANQAIKDETYRALNQDATEAMKEESSQEEINQAITEEVKRVLKEEEIQATIEEANEPPKSEVFNQEPEMRRNEETTVQPTPPPRVKSHKNQAPKPPPSAAIHEVPVKEVQEPSEPPASKNEEISHLEVHQELKPEPSISTAETHEKSSEKRKEVVSETIETVAGQEEKVKTHGFPSEEIQEVPITTEDTSRTSEEISVIEEASEHVPKPEEQRTDLDFNEEYEREKLKLRMEIEKELAMPPRKSDASEDVKPLITTIQTEYTNDARDDTQKVAEANEQQHSLSAANSKEDNLIDLGSDEEKEDQAKSKINTGLNAELQKSDENLAGNEENLSPKYSKKEELPSLTVEVSLEQKSERVNEGQIISLGTEDSTESFSFSQDEHLLKKIKDIEEESKVLIENAEKFEGSTSSDRYRELQETLTKHLIKLDNLESNDSGVRNERKRVIHFIQESLGLLEERASTQRNKLENNSDKD